MLTISPLHSASSPTTTLDPHLMTSVIPRFTKMPDLVDEESLYHPLLLQREARQDYLRDLKAKKTGMGFAKKVAEMREALPDLAAISKMLDSQTAGSQTARSYKASLALVHVRLPRLY